MADETTGSITEAFRQLRSGDADAAARLWQRFFPRLLGLARRTLAGRIQRAAGPDDAVQDAFASFFRRAQAGEFGDVLDRNELWSLLGVITVRKAHNQARREETIRRGHDRILDENALGRPGGPPALDALPAPPQTAAVDLAGEELLAQLDEDLRTIAVLRLLGYKNREIAADLGCTERKVERKLHLIRVAWEEAVPR
jgi:DNA-directed RNA polymerase specialized sigma24 family protein